MATLIIGDVPELSATRALPDFRFTSLRHMTQDFTRLSQSLPDETEIKVIHTEPDGINFQH